MYSIIKVLSEEGKKELDDLGVRGFDYPKPSELVRTLVKSVAFSPDDEAIVLDFFAGSGTTGDAVLRLNAEDGGRRRFICVQLPELCEVGSEASSAGYSSIADIGKDRIRRAIHNIEQDEDAHSGDLGFRVFKLSSSNITAWASGSDDLEEALLLVRDVFRDDRTEDDVLYEVLLKYGLPLASSVQRRDLHGVDVFWVADGALVVCLDGPVTERVAAEMAALIREAPNEVTRVVFADRSFDSDVDKTNVLQVLLSAGIDDIKCI